MNHPIPDNRLAIKGIVQFKEKFASNKAVYAKFSGAFDFALKCEKMALGAEKMLLWGIFSSDK